MGGARMQQLRVLVCGGDSAALDQVAQRLCDDGVEVEVSTRVVDQLCRLNNKWDLLLVDLDGLTSFLRGLLPAIRMQFPELSMLGISKSSAPDIRYLAYDLEMDGYLLTLPKPEDLIVRLPRLAAKYLCDTATLSAFGTQPLAA
jgi:DNA-binding response OmpR family regulator